MAGGPGRITALVAANVTDMRPLISDRIVENGGSPVMVDFHSVKVENQAEGLPVRSYLTVR